ncbi:MAG: FHA domain-containing protein [Candidatus Xenobia bacterium]
MDKDDILGTLKDGVNLAGKLAARGVGEAAKAVKNAGPGKTATLDSGLYFQRHLQPRFGNFMPGLEFQEVQAHQRQILGLLKNIAVPAGERIFMQGCQAMMSGAMAEARDRFQEATSKDTQLTDGYFLAGCVSLELNDSARAADAFQKALLCQGGLGARIRKYVPSVQMTVCLTENSSIVLFPDLIGLNMLSVVGLRAQGKSEEGVHALEQLQGVLPGHPLIIFYLACLHLEMGQYARVIEKTLSVQPESNLHLADLVLQGRAYIGLNDSQAFVEGMRKLLNRSDFDPHLLWDVRDTLARAYRQMGMAAEADREQAWLASKAPGHQDILERLGLVEASVKPKLVTAVPVKVQQPAASRPVAVARPVPAKSAWEGRLTSDDGKVDIKLTGAGVAIGREAGDIQLRWDTSVSMNHARIYWEGGQYWVEDLGSTNGTWVNSHRIGQPVDVNRGDVIAIGQTRITVI